MTDHRLTASCSCGKVELEATGRPIASVICYCDDCQAAAREIEAMPGAPRFREADGGTPLIAFRKDRVRWMRGDSLLKKLKRRDGSPTNRRLATCCNSVMLLDFDDSKHWADIYGARVRGNAPKPEMRLCTKFAAQPLSKTHDAPSYPGYPARFLLRLLAARLAMLLSR